MFAKIIFSIKILFSFFLPICNLSSCINSNSTDIIEIPFNLIDRRIVIDATINGARGKFVFDTGVTESHVNIQLDNLRHIGNTTNKYMGVSKKEKIYALNKILLGGTELKTHSWIINRSAVLESIQKEGYDGLLGIRVFEGYWCELSFSRNKIILHKKKPEYFSKWLPVNSIDKSRQYFSIPVNIDDNIIYCVIDTGMKIAMRFPKSVLCQKHTNDYVKVFSSDHVNQYHLVKTQKFTIMDETYINKFIMTNSYLSQYSNDDKYNNIGILGIDFLINYNILFDFTNLRNGKTTGIFYEPRVLLEERNYGFFSYVTNVPSSGILKMHYANKGLIIDDIIENGIAYNEFGLRPNMIITKINGKPIDDMTAEEQHDPGISTTIREYTILNNGIEHTMIRNEYVN
jgi:hypothetical protein